MKKIFYIIFAAVFAGLFTACDPLVDVTALGTVLTDSTQIQATVVPLKDASGNYTNKVMVHCTSPVLCSWYDGFNTVVSNDTSLIAYGSGTEVVTLTAMAANGTIIKKHFTTANITDMVYPVPAAYPIITGTGVKAWTWAATNCFGNGGPTDIAPAWWILGPVDVEGQDVSKGLPLDGLGATMSFAFHGMTMTKTSVGGAIAAGTFSLDLLTKRNSSCVGQITFYGTNILNGYDYNDAHLAAWSKYDIISLTDTQMVLSAQEHSPNSNYWYYVFVPVK